MSLRVVIDVNLSPLWAVFLKSAGHDACHWSSVGDVRTPDAVIFDWARNNGFVIFTHDLDFGAMLALTHASAPSVLQVRTQSLLPERIGALILSVLAAYEAALLEGAMVVVDVRTTRVRILPF